MIRGREGGGGRLVGRVCGGGLSARGLRQVFTGWRHDICCGTNRRHPRQGSRQDQNRSDSAAAQARVRSLLSKPSTADAAVQIALLNNRTLQAAYNELGASEAEMVEASLPPAPSLSLSNITGTGFEIERQVAQDVLAFFTLPRRREIAEDQFRAAQMRAVAVTLRTGADARRAYYRAMAAAQTVKFLEEARLAAGSISDLAKKLGETGALPKLDQAREHAFYAEVSGDWQSRGSNNAASARH